MRRYYALPLIVICVLLVFFGLNCGPPEQVDPAEAEEGAPKSYSPSYAASYEKPAVVFGVGDVEVATHVMTQLAAQSVNPTTRIQPFATPKNRLTREVIDFFPPYPEEIWVNVMVASVESFPGHAVHIRTTVSMDEKPLKTFSYVTVPDSEDPHQELLNISELSGGALPESFLLQSTSKITLYKFTDVSEIDVDNPPEAQAEDMATVTGNTLRVSFRS